MSPTAIMDTLNVSEAIEYEKALPVGSYEIRFYLTEPISDRDKQSIKAHLAQNGIPSQISQKKSNGLWYVAVQYRKPEPSAAIGFLPLAVIPLIAFGFVAVLVGIGIFKMQDITNNIGKILLIVFGGTIVLAALMRKSVEKGVEAYARR